MEKENNIKEDNKKFLTFKEWVMLKDKKKGKAPHIKKE